MSTERSISTDNFSNVGAADRIAALDTIAADALPCARLERLDGWRLRFNHGVTRRANSVLAEAEGALPLAEKLAAVEAFYARCGVPPRFQISPASQPAQLDEVLERRGYRFESGARVQVCPPGALAARADGFEVLCETLPSPAWLKLLATVDAAAAAKAGERAAALRVAGIEAHHLRVEREGVAMALGLGVSLDGSMGLFNMATHPEQRRRGAASAVVAALAARAGPALETLYLQVDPRNLAGRALYARLGFTTLYSYHYRVRDGA